MPVACRKNSAAFPVDGFVFARSVLDQKGDEAVAILLEAAGGNETDWLEKKAAVYRSEKADPDYRRKLEKLKANCPPGTIAKEVEFLQDELLAEVAWAIVAMHNSRGGVILVGIDDRNGVVPLAENDPDGILAGEGVEAYVRKAVLGRLRPEGGEFRFKKESVVLPVAATRVFPKRCRYGGTEILALLVPPLEREGMPLLATRTSGDSSWKSAPRRGAGDIGLVEKGRPEDRWIGTAAQLADFHGDRRRLFLDRMDLTDRFGKLGLSLPGSAAPDEAGYPAKEPFSSVRPPRAKNFVGREKELEELHGLLSDERIPVVTGPGGTGKTELVLQYAARHKADYPGGLFQVDMQGVSDWDRAFRAMLERPGVREALGLPENDDAENRRNDDAETGPDDRPPADADGGLDEDRAETDGAPAEPDDGADGKPDGRSAPNDESVRSILADRAGKEGPLLLVLDNVDPKNCKSLFKETALSGLDLPPGVRIVATARASDRTFPAGGICRETPLLDLSPDAAVELLLSDHPAASEAERKAVENIARILGFRILYLRAVPSLLDDDDSAYAGSWRALEMGLQNDLAAVVAAGMEGDENRTPSALWRMTERAFAANAANGNRWVLLARIASFFSPNLGVRKPVLSALWKRLAAPDGNPDIAFDQAANKLRKHGVLEDRDEGFGMHRLTCAAVRRSARKAAPDLEASVGSALAETGLSEKWDWISLAGSLPALASVPDILLDGRTCVAILLRNPKFADRCPWDKLNGPDWSRLLRFNPKFADRCPWDKLDGYDWTSLLSKQPQLAKQCAWKQLDGFDWAGLLCEQPQFDKHCPWDLITGSDWARLLAEQPKFADRCPWDKLAGSDWARLLAEQPEFADRCPWDKLAGSDWARLLAEQPKFADRCPWDTLAGSDWARLLAEQPKFADRCPWDKLEGTYWPVLLSHQPQFADRCSLDELDGWNWARILRNQPQLADRCPWDELDGTEWTLLLVKQPQFANNCCWNKLSGADWSYLLSGNPAPNFFKSRDFAPQGTPRLQFADRCPWEKLDGSDWANLLGEQPQLADRCQWDKLDGTDWTALLSRQPHFSDRCQWEKLDNSDWVSLLWCRMQFADRCPWDKLDSSDWWTLLRRQPQLSDRLWRSAEQGNAKAQCVLGEAFYWGRVLERNDKHAVNWWRMAAEGGNAVAQRHLGSAYRAGRGVDRNDEEAAKWWRMAADGRDAAGQSFYGRSLLLGTGVEKDEGSAVRYFSEAARRNNEHAFAWLGYCHASGTGTPKDGKAAESFFSKLKNPANGFNEIAWFLFEAGRTSEALSFAERAVATFRGNGTFPVRSQILILDTLAAVLDALERAEETKKVCAEILSLFPDGDDSENREVALVRLGRACQRLGDKPGATDAWSKALGIVEKHGGKNAEYGESVDELRRLIRE